MDRPLELVFRNVKSTPELEALVHERMARLEHLHRHIISCRATVTLQNKTHHAGNIPDVHIDLQVPGQSLVVNHRRLGGDVLAAIHNAFDAAALQLKEYKERKMGDVKRHEVPAEQLPVENVPPDQIDG